MSARIRGQEITARLTLDGQPLGGSFFKITEFTTTPRDDLTEEPFLGELEDDLDYMHHGWDFSFTTQIDDHQTIDFLTEIITREQNARPHPAITLTIFYTFRERTALSRTIVYRNVFLKVGEEGFSGRKDFVTNSFEGKAKRRIVLGPAQPSFGIQPVT